MGVYLGIAMANVVNIFNPEMIVVGGGVSAAWDLFAQPAREEVMRRAFQFPPRAVRLCAQNAEMMRDCSALRGWHLKMSFRQDLQNLQDSNREHALGIWDALHPVIPQGFTLLSC